MEHMHGSYTNTTYLYNEFHFRNSLPHPHSKFQYDTTTIVLSGHDLLLTLTAIKANFIPRWHLRKSS